MSLTLRTPPCLRRWTCTFLLCSEICCLELRETICQPEGVQSLLIWSEDVIGGSIVLYLLVDIKKHECKWTKHFWSEKSLNEFLFFVCVVFRVCVTLNFLSQACGKCVCVSWCVFCSTCPMLIEIMHLLPKRCFLVHHFPWAAHRAFSDKADKQDFCPDCI